MLNKIIIALISAKNSHQPSAMTTDEFENPATYTGWIYPLRYLLALRYLKQKQKVLSLFRAKKIYPILENDFKQSLIKQLSGKKNTQTPKLAKTPFYMAPFKSWLVYPTLIASLLFGVYSLNSWYQMRKIENVLANHLPYYSDLLHRKLLLKHNSHDSQLTKVELAIETEQQKILADLPQKKGIRSLMEVQLKKLKDSSVSSEDIMLGFKDINTLFDQKGLPYYLTPKSFSMPCSSLIDAPVEEMMMLKKMEELMSNGNPERCRTTMMTVYKVGDRSALYYQHKDKNGEKKLTELPLFQVKRVDKVPAIDSALGLTFKDRGIGSILLIDRIKNFSNESILPALTFQGRNYITPLWMQGHYEIEEAISRGYKKDLDSIYSKKTDLLKVKNTIKKLIKNKARMQNAKMEKTLEQTSVSDDKNIFGNGFDAISVLLNKNKKKNKFSALNEKNKVTQKELALLNKLNDVLLPSIEYHEAYHQINKKDWKTPSWIKKTFKDDLSKSGTDHTMEELGAYLSQLVHTEQAHNIWLSKLLIFSLNPMTKGQAEYYASGIILTTLDSLRRGSPIEPSYIASVDKKTEIYSALIALDKKEIRELAKRAYEVLFEREVPVLGR